MVISNNAGLKKFEPRRATVGKIRVVSRWELVYIPWVAHSRTECPPQTVAKAMLRSSLGRSMVAQQCLR